MFITYYNYNSPFILIRIICVLIIRVYKGPDDNNKIYRNEEKNNVIKLSVVTNRKFQHFPNQNFRT